MKTKQYYVFYRKLSQNKEAYQIVEISQESEENKHLQRSATFPQMDSFPYETICQLQRSCWRGDIFLTNTIL